MINITHVTKNDKIQRQVHITYYPFLMRVGQTVLPLFERAMLFTKLIQSVSSLKITFYKIMPFEIELVPYMPCCWNQVCRVWGLCARVSAT